MEFLATCSIIDEDFWFHILSFISTASTTAIKLRMVCKALKNLIQIDYEGMCSQNNWGLYNEGGSEGWKSIFYQHREIYLLQSRFLRTCKISERPIGGQKGATFCFTMDRTKLVCGGGKMQSDFLKVFDVSRGGRQGTRNGSRLTGQLLGHKGPVTGVHFMQDSYNILSSSLDKTLRIWQLRSDLHQYNPDDNLRCGQCVGKIQAHQDSVNCCLWDARCSQVWSGSSDGFVKVWDPSSFQMQFPTPISAYPISHAVGNSEVVGGCRCLAWNGSVQIFAGDGQGYVHMIDNRVADIVTSTRITTNGRQVSTLCALGHRVVAGDWEGAVKMWDTRMFTAENSPTLFKYNLSDRVNSVDFDEVKLVIGTEDGKVRICSSLSGGRPWRILNEDAAILFVKISGNAIGISKRLSPGDLVASTRDDRASIKIFLFREKQASMSSP